MSAAAATLERPLRVALIWNGTLHAEHVVERPRDIVLGSGRDALLPLPDEGAPERVTLLEGSAQGYSLLPSAGMRGYVFRDGVASAVGELSSALPLSSIDYGLVSFGTASVFFQHVRAVSGPAPRGLRRDGALSAVLGLSLFVHVALLLFLFLVAAKELAPAGALELDSTLVQKFLITPPPEELKQLTRARSDDGLRDPGLRERDDPGAQRAKEEEGRVGKRDATRDKTEISGEPADAIAAQVRGMGLLGVLSGGGKNALQDALRAPSLDTLLGGLGASQTVLGRGSGGFGLRGGGLGGGGTGNGALFGAGTMGTAVAGGKGLGAGKDGLGSRGRNPSEALVSLDSGSARVSGYLSREQVDRVVRANQAAIKYCFETALQRAPKLSGAVSVAWRIDRAGSVTTTRVAKSSLGDSGVEGCILRQVKRWKFPEPDGGEVDVTYPFIFRGH